MSRITAIMQRRHGQGQSSATATSTALLKFITSEKSWTLTAPLPTSSVLLQRQQGKKEKFVRIQPGRWQSTDKDRLCTPILSKVRFEQEP